MAADNRLEPVTDEAGIHGALTSWDPPALRAALLDPIGAPQHQEGSMEQVIAARRALGDELIAFREFVRGLSGEISVLTSVEDPHVLQAHLQQVVDTQVQPHPRELEKSIAYSSSIQYARC